jgi:hypothetical protein
VESNEEWPIYAYAGSALDERTPLWQHENAWIRLPMRVIRWLRITMNKIFTFIANLTSAVLSGLRSGILHVRNNLFRFIADNAIIITWVTLMGTMIGAGIPLGISLSRNEFPLGLLMLESASMIAWAIFTRLATKPGASQTSYQAV